MKKIFIMTAIILLGTNVVFGEDWNSTQALNRVNTIGNKIIQANGVKQNIEFKVSDEADINAYANLNKEVYVYRGLLEYVTDDQELAAVISHEIGHIVNGHCKKQGVLGTGINILAYGASKKINLTAAALGQQLAQSKMSRNDEFEADLTGADLMTKAGYNPLAMISVLNKICGNYIDILETHPSGEKRLLNIYNYVEYNYPSKLTSGYNSESYQKALLVINPTVQKRKSSTSLTAKYEKQQEKLLAKKEKRAKKLSKSSTVWDGYYSALTLMLSE